MKVPALLWPALLTFAASHACGQTAFDEWWQRISQCGATGPSTDGVVIAYTVQERFVPPIAELTALRAAVSGHPDHPQRDDLARYDAILRGELQGRTNRVWRLDGEWRWSSESISDQDSFFDMSWSNGVAWRMDQRSLAVVDQLGVARTNLRIDSAGSSISADMCTLLTANIATIGALGFDLRPVLKDTRWSVDGTGLINGASKRFTARGTWRPSEGWGTISDASLIDTATGTVARSLQLTDWSFCEPLHIGTPGTILELASTGAPRRSTRLEVRPVLAAEVHRLFKIPTATEADPVRGIPTFVAFTDLRKGQSAVVQVDPETRKASKVALDSDTFQNPGLRIWGWAALGGTLALVLVLWYRRRVL